MERTFAIVKPNAMKKRLLGKILNMVQEAGFEVVEGRIETLSKNKAEEFYGEHRERPFFRSLVDFMTQGPVFVMVLQADGAVEKYRKLMGATDPAKAAPGTLRALYGESIEANSLHGSDSAASAAREIEFFFGRRH